MKSSIFLRLGSLAFLALLNACTTTPTHTHFDNAPIEWQEHYSLLKHVKHFQTSGKIGYITSAERESLYFHYKKVDSHQQLTLTSFLGQTLLELSISDEGATAKTYDDKVFTASSGNALIQQLTGLSLPIDAFSLWLLGLPNSDYQATYHDSNLLKTVVSPNSPPWKIHYLSYQNVDMSLDNPSVVESIPLPSRIKLQTIDTNEQTKINILITSWTISK
ncbi:lipoprotein insertase outer membrane protein LolB [Vibrio sp.]|nr:lipoprotein insertase outer membrane protein LolB [Vibrio sp.]